jgi:hypothetical protein
MHRARDKRADGADARPRHPAAAARPRRRGDRVKRREFIALLGSAATWPLTAQAQQGERVRRIGVLANQAIDEPETQVRVTAFVRRLQELGWTEGRNLQIEHRWAAGDTDNARRYAAELVAAPDVILASGASIVSALQRATRTPQHISGLPAEVRNAIAPFARACGGRLVAQHSFASYFQRGTAKLIGLHFEHLRCANRAAICSAAGCLHQVYISTGGRYRLLSSSHVPELDLTQVKPAAR